MKKEFAQLVKDMRVLFHPEFKSIANNKTLTADQFDEALSILEEKQKQMIIDSGFTQSEFESLCREHFMDFSSNLPEEWIVKYDPDNAHILVKQ